MYGLVVENAGSYPIAAYWGGASGGAAVYAKNTGTGGDAIQANATGSGRSAIYAWGSTGVDYALRADADGATWAGYFEGDTHVSGTCHVSRSDNGRVLSVSGDFESGQMVSFDSNADVSSNDDILEIEIGSGSSSDCQFIECEKYGVPFGDIEFRVYGDGEVTADGSFSAGGADIAEMIAVSDGAETVRPGDVLVIDPTAVEGVTRSNQPRSRLVAGVYSTKPGFVGSRREWDGPPPEQGREPRAYTMSDMAVEYDEIPMAVLGIVPCKVSAENGPIRPGDLLVTSSIPGHAMRDDDPGVGTVLGKALDSINTGTGTINVLVTLQ
jgi:hypothetical protein